MGKWIVIGGSGFIGNAVVQQARRAGHVVESLVAPRLELNPKASAADIVTAAQQLILGPVGSSLLPHFEEADVVINAAGVPLPDSASSATLWGANALLPAVLAVACQRESVRRYIHLSSVAVQGRMVTLDASPNRQPFSPYSLSKARGEEALELLAKDPEGSTVLAMVRATSVQGDGRNTTDNLTKFAQSKLASVAAPGTYPSPVSFVDSLASFVVHLGERDESPPLRSVQPWEGFSVREVLEHYGAKNPIVLPKLLCRTAVGISFGIARIGATRFFGIGRRLEVTWFGQKIESEFGLPLPRTPGK